MTVPIDEYGAQPLFQFRFGDADQFGPYMLRPPPYLVHFWGVFYLYLFWNAAKAIEPVGVRDIYALESKAALCKVAITNMSG